MIKTIKIGEKEVTLKSSAATNILYKKTFGELASFWMFFNSFKFFV